MEKLYQENSRYTPQANDWEQAVHEAVAPLFRAWVKLGYSPRELSHIAHSCITEMELDAVLVPSLEEYKRIYKDQYLGTSREGELD